MYLDYNINSVRAEILSCILGIQNGVNGSAGGLLGICWMDKWMSERVNEWMNEWMTIWMICFPDRTDPALQNSPCSAESWCGFVNEDDLKPSSEARTREGWAAPHVP